MQNRGRNQHYTTATMEFSVYLQILVCIAVLSERYEVGVAPGIPKTALAHLGSLNHAQRDALEFPGDRRINRIIHTLLLRYNLPSDICSVVSHLLISSIFGRFWVTWQSFEHLKSNQTFTHLITNVVCYCHSTACPPVSVEGKNAANSLEKLVGLMISKEVGMEDEAERLVQNLFVPIINVVVFGIHMAECDRWAALYLQLDVLADFSKQAHSDLSMLLYLWQPQAIRKLLVVPDSLGRTPSVSTSFVLPYTLSNLF